MAYTASEYRGSAARHSASGSPISLRTMPAVQRLVDPQHPIGLNKARIPQRASINCLEAEARDQR